MRRCRWLVGLVLVFVPALCAGQSSLDQVFLSRGALTRGTITEVSREQVKLDSSGNQRTFAVSDIARVTFANEPSELNSARGHVLQKSYAPALVELRKLDTSAIDRDLIKHDVEFFKALCQARLALADGGDKNAAIAALTAFAASAPQSFHFYETAEVLGELALAVGKYADAARYYASLAQAPWPEYQLRANAQGGRALAQNRQYDAALARFEAALASSASSPEAARHKLLAAVGKGVCFAETGKAEAGLKLIQDLIERQDTSDAVFLGRAYNAIGRCYRKMGQPKEALLAYLHTDLLYSGDAESHAEALYYLHKLWTEVNKGDRAAAAKGALDARYGGSVWATMP